MHKPKAESVLFQFWTLRQANCEFPLDVVHVHWVGGGVANKCLANALGMLERGHYSLISGWLVTPFDQSIGWQIIAQHWWNYDINANVFVDPSPDIESGSIYIIDMDICHFAQQNKLRLTSFVPLDVMYREHAFHLIRKVGEELYARPIQRLTSQVLYEPFLV